MVTLVLGIIPPAMIAIKLSLITLISSSISSSEDRALAALLLSSEYTFQVDTSLVLVCCGGPDADGSLSYLPRLASATGAAEKDVPPVITGSFTGLSKTGGGDLFSSLPL